MKTYNITLETTIEAESQEEAERIAYNNLSIVKGDEGYICDCFITEVRVLEAK